MKEVVFKFTDGSEYTVRPFKVGDGYVTNGTLNSHAQLIHDMIRKAEQTVSLDLSEKVELINELFDKQIVKP